MRQRLVMVGCLSVYERLVRGTLALGRTTMESSAHIHPFTPFESPTERPARYWWGQVTFEHGGASAGEPAPLSVLASATAAERRCSEIDRTKKKHDPR